MTIGNDASTKVDVNAMAIELDSGPGGIELNSSGGDVNIEGTGGANVKLTGQIRLTSQGDLVDAITLRTSGGASETISLTNVMGTGESAISMTSVAGGVDIDAGATKDVNIAGGQIVLNSKDNSAQAISLRTNVGMSETILFANVQGTSENALNLTSVSGGVDVMRPPVKTLASPADRCS